MRNALKISLITASLMSSGMLFGQASLSFSGPSVASVGTDLGANLDYYFDIQSNGNILVSSIFASDPEIGSQGDLVGHTSAFTSGTFRIRVTPIGGGRIYLDDLGDGLGVIGFNSGAISGGRIGGNQSSEAIQVRFLSVGSPELAGATFGLDGFQVTNANGGAAGSQPPAAAVGFVGGPADPVEYTITSGFGAGNTQDFDTIAQSVLVGYDEGINFSQPVDSASATQGSPGYALNGFTFTIIPEPSVFGLLFGGVALAGVMLRRRR